MSKDLRRIFSENVTPMTARESAAALRIGDADDEDENIGGGDADDDVADGPLRFHDDVIVSFWKM